MQPGALNMYLVSLLWFDLRSGFISLSQTGTIANMKLALAASLVASAAAFAPSAKQASSSAIKGYENEIGVVVSERFQKARRVTHRRDGFSYLFRVFVLS